MSKILLITDVARLRRIFGCLAEDNTVHLRIANNLEKGGEEIAKDRPDIVFVQTHLSGLSAEILLMHLKKQLDDKLSDFILLAAPNQVSETILAPFQGWLDTSLDDDQLLSDIRALFPSLAPKEMISNTFVRQDITSACEPDSVQSANVASTESATAASDSLTPGPVPTKAESAPEVTTAPLAENSPDENGITYPPHPRLSVYSEFNSSFDNAVIRAPEPESIEQSTSTDDNNWLAEHMATDEAPPQRSKRLTFMMWLAPVVIAVIVMTVLQQRLSRQVSKSPSVTAKPAALPGKNPSAVFTHLSSAVLLKPVLKPVSSAGKAQSNMVTDPAAQINDKAMIMAITENQKQKKSAGASLTIARPTRLPEFIPQGNIDRTYSESNPGWERYTSQEFEFRVYREKDQIKALQVIALGNMRITNVFLNRVYKQLSGNATFTIDSTETKEGYKIERGHIADNLNVVYYRDEKGNKMRAFVFTWK